MVTPSEDCLVEVSKKIGEAHPAVGHDFPVVYGVHVNSDVVTKLVGVSLSQTGCEPTVASLLKTYHS